MKTILETINLNKAFYLGEAVYAVNNVNLQILEGEIAMKKKKLLIIVMSSLYDKFL